MELMLRTLKSDALYKLQLNKKVLLDIINLMDSYRTLERPIKLHEMDRILYVVFADCLGDALDIESSDAFYTSNFPNLIFVDPHSCTNQWVLISHELVHSLQQSLYLFSQDRHYDDWTEVMARDLQYKVRDLLCTKNIIFEFLTDSESEIEDFLQKNKITMLYHLLENPPITEILNGDSSLIYNS